MQRTLSISEAVELALRHHEAGDFNAARQIYQQVLRVEPRHHEALHLLGLAELQSGNAENAVQLISRAIELSPLAAHYHLNLGEALRTVGRLDHAETAIREAIRLDPQSAAAHRNLGIILQDAGRIHDACASYRQSIALDPQFLDAHLSLAAGLGNSGDLAGAYAAALHAIHLNPNDPRAYEIAGAAAAEAGNPSDATKLLRAALDIDPTSASAWTNLAVALGNLGSHRDALAAHRRSIELAPDDPKPRSMMLMTLLRSDETDEITIAEAHCRWGQRFASTHISTPPKRSSSKLRVGYVSGDFNAHPVPTFLLPILAAHDRANFEITCYATSDRRDHVTARCRERADHWRDITHLDDFHAAEQIRRDGIDILIDLSGHSKGNRLELFARRPAPVQITYLGYPATTGVEAIDFRITDEICDPPGQNEHLHTEGLLRVSAPFLCFEPPPTAPPVAPLPLDQNGYITFGAFNAAAKITPSTLAAWSRILHAVPRSRMLIKGLSFTERETKGLWLTRFAAHGISSDRLDFRGYVSTDEHLSLITSCDIALDTFPYCGTTTTCNSLWTGVPVVTLAGGTHVSRVGLTLLNSVGLTDLAATGGDDYVSKAIALANDITRLREVRTTLRGRVAASPLTDGKRLAREIELVCRSIS